MRSVAALLFVLACSSEPAPSASAASSSASSHAPSSSVPSNPRLPALTAACDKGDGAQCFALAEELRHEGNQRGVDAAYQALRAGCAAKHNPSCALADWCLAHGVGVKPDERAGHAGLKKSCGEDNAEACLTLYSDWAKEIEEIEEEPKTAETEKEKVELLLGMAELRDKGTKVWAAACEELDFRACDRLGAFVIAAFLGRQAIAVQLDRAEALALVACPPSRTTADPGASISCSQGCKALPRLAAILRGEAKETVFSEVPRNLEKAAALDALACLGGCVDRCSPHRPGR